MINLQKYIKQVRKELGSNADIDLLFMDKYIVVSIIIHLQDTISASEVIISWDELKEYKLDAIIEAITTCYKLIKHHLELQNTVGARDTLLSTTKQAGWFNIYRSNIDPNKKLMIYGPHDTRECADKIAKPDRIDCVFIEWQE